MCKEIVLNKGLVIVDDEDYELLSDYKWHIDNKGYAKRSVWINNTCEPVFMHHQILNMNSEIIIDHRNGNPLDNRKENLRVCTQQQNCFNRRARTGCYSPFKGVSWHKKTQKWIAAITFSGKRIHLGYFHSDADGAKAYNTKAVELFGEFARLNDI